MAKNKVETNSKNDMDQQVLTSPGIFQSFLMSARQLTGATTASLSIASSSGIESTPLVFHVGEMPPIPELETTSSALKYTAEADKRLPSKDHGDHRSLFHLYNSSVSNGYLLRISLSDFVNTLESNQDSDTTLERRRSDLFPLDSKSAQVLWIGLRYDQSVPPLVLSDLKNHVISNPNEMSEISANWLVKALSFGAYMAWQADQLANLLQDPVTRLPGRIEFENQLRKSLDEAKRTDKPLGLILLNPDEFGSINQRLNRKKGDQALAEIAENIFNCLRRTDTVFRYGGAIFIIILQESGKTATKKIAEKLRYSLTGSFLDNAVRLSFSVGATVYENDKGENLPVDSIEMLRQADHALNLAKISGGGSTVLWNADASNTSVISLDRLSGIFTADTEKDYRNMLMLWDTIAVISADEEMETIAAKFVERIVSTLKPTRIGLFLDKEEGLQLLAVSHDKVKSSTERIDKPDLKLSQKQKDLLVKVRERKRTERLGFPNPSQGTTTANKKCFAYAVPMIARDNYLGCLYIDGPEDVFSLDSSDLIFLNALANQVALALDRAELAIRWKKEKERESQQLREEVRELRQVLHSARLVYRSSQMQSVLDTLRAVAPTDVTILITGESGTGKEMLARAVHEQSTRHQMPFITVDCGAIAHSLMEAELFGYMKGAYTGAQNSSDGQIVQAEGGTLFLDEIGEIPLDVQAKLLRFVQEKEINPVGATRSRQVDVRIVAATNRDLANEVAAGRFRGDLYYRLQVVTLTSPPLRERPDDILPLAQHFLEKFTVQYEKGVRRLSSDAETAILDYRWPGNVRELQNTILRTVVMSKTEKIRPLDLQLNDNKASNVAEANEPTAAVPATIPLQHAHQVKEVAPSNENQQQNEPVTSPKNFDNPWQELRLGLVDQIHIAIDDNNGAGVPLGRWLTEDLVLEADKAANGVARQASFTIGLAETTFRRQLEKVKRGSQTGMLKRTPTWSSLKPILPHLLILTEGAKGSNVIEQARQMLLDEVVAKVSDDDALGSVLMGVTVPTYRRWTNALS